MAPMTLFLLLTVMCVVAVVQAAQMSSPEGLEYLETNSQKKGVNVLPSGLQYRVLSSATDPDALSPNVSTTCHVHYRGTTVKGMEFDSSHKRGKPTQFAPQDVIAGWKEALLKMREGDKWQVVVPAELAYGKRSMGEYITPGSVLVFDMELVKVDAAPAGAWAAVTRYLPRFARDVPLGVWLFLAYFVYNIFSSPADHGKKTVSLQEVSGGAHNDCVYMDIQVGDEEAQRVEFELFSKHCPKTAANFLHLCLGDKGKGVSGKELAFLGSAFHRIIPGFMAQGGDFTAGNGTGGESIYGTKFSDEWTNGVVPHDEKHLLSMANAGPGTNGSQFFLTFAKCSWLDGKHVVFGKVVSGGEAVTKLEEVGSQSGRTHKPVKVVACGVVKRGVKEGQKEEALAAKPKGDKKKD